MPMDDGVTISALLPVHAGVDPMHLSRALQSLVDQTRKPNELILVEDGPLTEAHHAVIEHVLASPPFTVEILRLATNCGAGVANGTGLRRARGEWIAKADADDINMPERLERQLEFVLTRRVDVCGSAMAEFEGSEDNVTAIRANPSDHKRIARRMRINSPVNHPTAFYRREAALAVGGYSDMRFMQDYDLWARMLVDGSTFANMPDPLVKFRAGEDMYRRRTSVTMNRCEWTLQWNLRHYGIIGTAWVWPNLLTRLIFRRLPTPLLRAAYRLLLHGRRLRPSPSR
jgi:glycosyltransferase involved in cell wall biosynthesis